MNFGVTNYAYALCNDKTNRITIQMMRNRNLLKIGVFKIWNDIYTIWVTFQSFDDADSQQYNNDFVNHSPIDLCLLSV